MYYGIVKTVNEVMCAQRDLLLVPRAQPVREALGTRMMKAQAQFNWHRPHCVLAGEACQAKGNHTLCGANANVVPSKQLTCSSHFFLKKTEKPQKGCELFNCFALDEILLCMHFLSGIKNV